MSALQLTQPNLVKACDEVIRAQNELCRSLSVQADVAFELEVAEAQAICAGVEGSNEAQRKATLRLQLASHHQDLLSADAGVRDARRDLDIAQARLDCLRYQLRLREVHHQAGRA